MTATPTGVLLVNLGTPDAPEPGAVRRYLAEFLSDPLVIDIPAPLRWLLLHGYILRTRPQVSAAAYAKVWMDGGSPLMVHGRALTERVAVELGDSHVVRLGMRYGRPSIREALGELVGAGARRVVVLPLYPHAAASSTGSTELEVARAAATFRGSLKVTVVPPFHADSGWQQALAAVLAPPLAAARADHVLLSFHGLPERHVRRATAGTPGAACLDRADCCAALGPQNAACYRAQCHATARSLASSLGLAPGGWSIGFQSRLGRTPWIQPHSDVVWKQLAARGVKRLAVACPGFTADCLETLEEIGIRARDDFRAHGGEDLILLPCPNAHPSWVQAVANLVRRAERS